MVHEGFQQLMTLTASEEKEEEKEQADDKDEIEDKKKMAKKKRKTGPSILCPGTSGSHMSRQPVESGSGRLSSSFSSSRRDPTLRLAYGSRGGHPTSGDTLKAYTYVYLWEGGRQTSIAC